MGSLHFPSHVEVETVPDEEDIRFQHEDLVYGWDQFLASGADVEALWKLLPHLPEARMSVQSLEAKYARLDREGEHPLYPMADWSAAAAAGTTESWYWLWVHECISGARAAHSLDPLTRVMPHEPGVEPATPMSYTAFLAGFDPRRPDSRDRRMVLTIDSDLQASMPIIEAIVNHLLDHDLPARPNSRKQAVMLTPGDADECGLRVHLRSGYRVTVESEVGGKQETTSVNAGSLWWCYRTLESAIELHLLNCDASIDPQHFDSLYKHANEAAEHPLFTRSAWVDAIQKEQALEGYWEWTSHRIDSRLRRLEQVASVDSPSP